MFYLKSSEIQRNYHVSKTTVHNWISAAKQSKLSLELFEKNGKTYIVNSPDNLRLLEAISSEGKKKRNIRYVKTVKPSPTFFELYSRKQILDIINCLSIHREIPRQYNFIGEGANNWDAYTRQLMAKKVPNLLEKTIELINNNMSSIDMLLSGYDKVNIIDIGPGNALPVRDLLDHLLKQNKIHRYIAIDISKEMLNIVERNIKEWFGDKIRFEGYVRDITHERFDDLVADDMLNEEHRTINLALLLGATPMNFREPEYTFKVARDSLGSNDLLMYSDIPDSKAERTKFDSPVNSSVHLLSPNRRYVSDLLNIDESFYEISAEYNEEKKMRYINVTLNTSLIIDFQSEGINRKVQFDKGDVILLWRAWCLSSMEIISDLEKPGFTLLQSSLTQDREYLLTILGVRRD